MLSGHPALPKLTTSPGSARWVSRLGLMRMIAGLPDTLGSNRRRKRAFLLATGYSDALSDATRTEASSDTPDRNRRGFGHSPAVIIAAENAAVEPKLRDSSGPRHPRRDHYAQSRCIFTRFDEKLL
jgi:hypothetical protein